MQHGFGPDDVREFERLGVAPAEVERQIHLFENPPAYMALDRACRIGDGIRKVDCDDPDRLGRYEEARAEGRLMRFVPASGAASRMFQSLLWAWKERAGASRSDLEALAAAGDPNAREVLVTLGSIDRLPFADDLARVTGKRPDPAAIATAAEVHEVLEGILSRDGLDYAALPKGLLKFHRYPDRNRTAFEEHLAETAAYMRDRDGTVRLHCTVSPEHREGFRGLLERVRADYEAIGPVRFEVGFSVQKSSTDTIAVDLANRPFRSADGRLVFRPGGHGALIENLNELGGDVVHVQNIDNVVPDRLRAEVLGWKRILIGELLAVQEGVFAHLAALEDDGSEATVKAASRFARDVLAVELPERLAGAGAPARREFLRARLARPCRVCGMVPNTGEPGGGPFWVRSRDGGLSRQIVESAEVDPGSAEQQSIFAAATHFNPVHLVCGLRDRHGRPYDLHRFIDAEAVFIARKSRDGRPLKALERPGLWNGAMSDWNTVFVEIPGSTFTPVKTVNDLLRAEHQPGS